MRAPGVRCAHEAHTPPLRKPSIRRPVAQRPRSSKRRDSHRMRYASADCVEFVPKRAFRPWNKRKGQGFRVLRPRCQQHIRLASPLAWFPQSEPTAASRQGNVARRPINPANKPARYIAVALGVLRRLASISGPTTPGHTVPLTLQQRTFTFLESHFLYTTELKFVPAGGKATKKK